MNLTPSQIEAERLKFEAELGQVYPSISLYRGHQHDYVNTVPKVAWKMWLARASEAPAPQETAVVKIRTPVTVSYDRAHELVFLDDLRTDNTGITFQEV